MTTDVVLSIVHYGDASVTARCVDSILSDTVEAFARRILIVVVDGSTMPEWIEHACSIVHVRNNGYAAAHNAAIRWTAHEVAPAPLAIGFLNNDLVVGPGVIDQLTAALQANDCVGAIAPQQIDKNGDVIDSGYQIQHKWYDRYDLRGHRPVGNCEFVDILHGPFILARFVKVVQVGGWSEGYFHYWEDDDLSVKLVRSGCRLAVSSTPVDHLFGSSMNSATPGAVYYSVRNRILFVKDTFGVLLDPASLLAGVKIALQVGCLGSTKIKRKRALAAVLGLVDALRGQYGPMSDSVRERLLT